MGGSGQLWARGAALIFLLGAGCFPKGWHGDNPPLSVVPDFPFSAGPYLLSLGPNAVAVVIEQDLKAPPVVLYGPAAQMLTGSSTQSGLAQTIATARDGLYVAELIDLPDEEELAYVLKSELGEVGPLTFRAGRPRGQGFRFAAFGDTRTGHQVHRALIEAMVKEDIDLVIHSGDMVEIGGFYEQWRTFFRIEGLLISRRPLFGAIGNHDVSRKSMFEHYMLSERLGGRYYARDWGDLRIVVMDSEVDARPGSSQYELVQHALAEGAAQDRLMVIVLHYPPYSSGEHGSHMELRAVLGELAPRYGVELVLAGHDHDYERTKPIDGVTYIVAASSGATIRRMSPSNFSVTARTEPHFLLFDVDRGALVGRAINLAGDTFDAFVIPPNPPRKLP